MQRHLDQPMEHYSNPVEAPNWGNADYGCHTVDLGGMRYPRTVHPPRFARIEVELLAKEIDGTYTIRFTVTEPIDINDPRLGDVLHELGNLLQENVGAVDVFATSASRADYLRTLYVDWQILPPGEAQQVVQIVIGGSGSSERVRVQERMDVLLSLKPTKLVVGTDNFERYFGALITDNLVVFENAIYGNAMYVMGLDWQANSQRARVELLSSASADFTRITHTGSWQVRLQREVKERLLREQQQP